MGSEPICPFHFLGSRRNATVVSAVAVAIVQYAARASIPTLLTSCIGVESRLGSA